MVIFVESTWSQLCPKAPLQRYLIETLQSKILWTWIRTFGLLMYPSLSLKQA